MLERQFDPVTDERFALDQLPFRHAIGRAECMDQADARGVAPDEHGRSRHQVGFDPLCPDNPLVAPRGFADHVLEALEIQRRIGQRMGQIEDRVVGLLPVDTVQDQLALFRQAVEDHAAGALHGGQLRRIAEEDERGEDLLQIIELSLIQHRAFIDETDIQRILPPLPADDEV